VVAVVTGKRAAGLGAAMGAGISRKPVLDRGHLRPGRSPSSRRLPNRSRPPADAPRSSSRDLAHPEDTAKARRRGRSRRSAKLDIVVKQRRRHHAGTLGEHVGPRTCRDAVSPSNVSTGARTDRGPGPCRSCWNTPAEAASSTSRRRWGRLAGRGFVAYGKRPRAALRRTTPGLGRALDPVPAHPGVNAHRAPARS